ncbi:MAG: heavy metal transporter [Kordia sp.]|nr:MAG: heavy metal transporter [Kordia sp.]
MKTLKLVAIAFTFLATISCKKEQKEVEVITVDTIEKVKKSTISEDATLAKVQFNIEGMTCAIGCAAKIQKSLGNMDGVKKATVNFENKTAIVEYDVDQINTKLLAERVVLNGNQFKVSNFQTATSKGCKTDCTKACCTKKCVVKCTPDCTKADCAKCIAKTAECKAKCAAKKLAVKSCKPGCEKECCAKKSTCEAGCTKPCCAKKEIKACKPGCVKACCSPKA